MWASVSDKDGRSTAGAKLYGVLVSTLSLGWVEGTGEVCRKANVPKKPASGAHPLSPAF